MTSVSASKQEISFMDLVTPETRTKFLEEADDILLEIESDLLQLTETPADHSPVKTLFRNVHSLKGNCGFMGFSDLEKLLHTEETLLETIKDGSLKNIQKASEMLLEVLDIIKDSIADIHSGGHGAVSSLNLYVEIINNHLPKGLRVPNEAPTSMLGEILVQQGAINQEDLEEALEAQHQTVGEILINSGTASAAQIETALKVQNELRPKNISQQTVKATTKRQDIRVDLDKLDTLINLIGEMVIAENMVINNPDLNNLELESFSKASQHMEKIVRELQEMAMIIRMIPISGLFRRMIRLVHDLSRKSGKKVDLELIGEGTEVDKTVIEKITDPLVHLIRNSMDHGIEDSDTRIKAGKPETGSLKLSASHEEGEIRITLVDDGHGMDRDRLIAKGIERGIVSGDGSQLSESDALQLIFQPGFSMAEKITDISGRGVGMDVVRQNLESIKGRIDVSSTLGEGTKISLRIPLTLAIIDGMLVRTGTAHYILPILSIRESFRPAAAQITIAPDGQELVKVRESIMPVIRLHRLHKVTPDYRDLDKGILIVLESSKSPTCLFVDELMGQQQTVIKGLSDYIGQLGDVGGVSGCTILGNGEVSLILDVRALEELACR
nr:chemotaxis protein CheA [Desulfobulbaceae bacterium]